MITVAQSRARERQRKAVIRAAIGWWRGRRPVVYNEKQHLDNPEINCNTERERELAKAVAYYKRGV